MDWSSVGGWLKEKGGGLVKLAGAVAMGNVPAGIAAVASMVTEATGEIEPAQALAKLQADPATMVRLEELALQREQSLRSHHEKMLALKLEDQQKAHEQQQLTIRQGDTATDEYVRRTRPQMATQSWYATIAYCFVTLLAQGIGVASNTELDLFDVYVAGILSAPAWAYLGFRTGDKFADAWKQRGPKK